MTLPLDTWRAFCGFPPWHFWQFADGPGNNAIVPIDSKCSTLVFEHDWQGSDAAGRASLRESIREAERMLLDYLGYRVAPEYVETTVAWPRLGDASMGRLRDYDATGRRLAVLAPEGYIQAMGIEQLTLIGTATATIPPAPGDTLVYSAVFNAGLQDTFTITLPTTVTDPAQIAVYFAAADRFDGEDFSSAVGDHWRIEPVQVTISGGNVVIVGRKWLVGKPLLYQNPVAAALNPQTATNFVSSLEVYQRTTDGSGNTVTTSQATLIYESNNCGPCWGRCCCGGGPPAGSDPDATGLVIARAGIPDSVLGQVTPGAATYDPTTGAWSSAWCCAGNYCDPDRVTLRYLAGYPLDSDGQFARKLRAMTCQLAGAEAKRRICACRETNERLFDLQQDLSLEATQSEKYTTTTEQLNNPFGTRRGHVKAWRTASDLILRRGIHA
jgi:hypothetical protein